MKLRLFLVLALMVPPPLFGECPNAVRLKVGDVVRDCERIGLSVPEELEVRKTLKAAETDREYIEGQAKLLTLKDLTISTLKEESTLYKADSVRERTDSDRLREQGQTKFLIGVGVGVLTMLVAAWGWSLTR